MTDLRPGGRRAAARRGPRPLRFGVVAAAAMLAVAVALVLLTPSTPGAAERPGAVKGSPVTSTSLGCPQLRSAPAGTSTTYGVGLAALSQLGSSGSLSTTPGDGIDIERSQTAAVPSTSGKGLTVQAKGEKAQGVFAWRADSGSTTAVIGCDAPRASWWFTGAGATLDHESRLTLANLDEGPATVDVRVLSPDGEQDVSETGGRGIELHPGEHRSISLVDLSPQSDELSIRVHATRGRVVAAIDDALAPRPGDRRGHEWMPAQVQPERIVRLTGLPPRARSRKLIVGNPSRFEAVVTVELAGPSGRVVPAGLEETSVAPGSVVQVDLSSATRGNPVAVRVRASRPVVASVRSVQGSGDLSYAGATEPLSGPAASPVLGDSSVQLTAGAERARARITALDSGGDPLGAETLSLPAHSTQAWQAPSGAAYVVVEPNAGRVFGAVVHVGAAAPLRDLPVTVRVPAVEPGF